jgi:hypothetical protein
MQGGVRVGMRESHCLMFCNRRGHRRGSPGGKGFETKRGRNDITYLDFLSAACTERGLPSLRAQLRGRDDAHSILPRCTIEIWSSALT